MAENKTIPDSLTTGTKLNFFLNVLGSYLKTENSYQLMANVHNFHFLLHQACVPKVLIVFKHLTIIYCKNAMPFKKNKKTGLVTNG